MSQWAEIRHLHLVERVPKKEIARGLRVDVKTVRRAIDRSTPPVRVSPLRISVKWNTHSGDVEHGFRRSGTLVGAQRR